MKYEVEEKNIDEFIFFLILFCNKILESRTKKINEKTKTKNEMYS